MNVFICLYRLKEVFTEQPSDERRNIYFIFEHVEHDLERYLKLKNPLDINQIRVCNFVFDLTILLFLLFRILLNNY